MLKGTHRKAASNPPALAVRDQQRTRVRADLLDRRGHDDVTRLLDAEQLGNHALQCLYEFGGAHPGSAFVGRTHFSRCPLGWLNVRVELGKRRLELALGTTSDGLAGSLARGNVRGGCSPMAFLASRLQRACCAY